MSRINYVDVLLSLFVALIFIINETVPDNVVFQLLLFILVYSSSRLLFSIFPIIANRVVLLGIVLVCTYELYLGISQLLGLSSSNHYLFSLTGSFDNPGPYGGFLAICLSIVCIFVLKNGEKESKKIASRIFLWILYLFIIVAVFILPLTRSRSAILAFGCSIIVYIIQRYRHERFFKKFLIWTAPFFVVFCAVAYLYKKPSADGRFFINRICVSSIKENGITGAGLGNFGGTYGKAQYLYFKKRMIDNPSDEYYWKQLNEKERLTADCPDRAFNEFMQICVENGLFMMILFIVIITMAIIKSFKNGQIWGYGLITFSLFSMFSYPLHVIQFQILLSILLAACSSSQLFNKTVLIFTPALLLTSFLLLRFLPEIKSMRTAEREWKKVERWYLHENYEYAAVHLKPLFQYMKNNHHYLFAYGQSLNKINEFEKSDSILMLGTKKSSDPMFWNVMGNNSLELGKYRVAEDCYKHAFYMVPNRLYPLYLLAKLYYTEGDTVRFLNMADKVETFIPKVESTNTEQLREEIRDIKASFRIRENE